MGMRKYNFLRPVDLIGAYDNGDISGDSDDEVSLMNDRSHNVYSLQV